MIDQLGSGMQAQWLRQQVLANNLANANTAGFKRDDIRFEPDQVAVPWFSPLDARQAPVDPGTPVQWTDFSQGAIRPTGRVLDVALSGPGFLAVETEAGPRYTRAGALDVRDGYLVLPGAGRILGQGGPIAVRGGQISIDDQGQVQDAGRVVDRLRVVEFPPTVRLQKQGNGLFVPPEGAAEPAPSTTTQVVGSALEEANVSAVGTLVGLIEVHRTFEAYQRMIQAIDDADRQATTEIGRA